MKRITRVLVAKPGLDGHYRGAVAVAYGLRDRGMEVIYSGLRKTPEWIAKAAVEEAVDVLGLSIMSGAHLHLCKKTKTLLDQAGVTDILWLVGGIIPAEDIPLLREMGVDEVFTPGTSIDEIAACIHAYVSYT